MLLKSGHLFWGVIFLFCLSSIGFAQDKSTSTPAIEKLVADLAAAKTDEERELLLKASKELLTTELQRSLIKEGNRFITQGEYTHAFSVLQIAKNVARQIGDKIGIARTVNSIGDIYRRQSNYIQALEHFQKSLDLGEELKDKQIISRALLSMGIVKYLQGNYSHASEYYQKSLALSEELKDKVGVTRLLNNIGVLYRAQGNYNQALEYYQKSLALSEELNDKEGIASALFSIGEIYRLQGNNGDALNTFQKSLVLREELKDKSGVANLLNSIGIVYESEGNYEKALDCYKKSLAIKEELNDKMGIANTQNNIGNVWRSQGDYEQAINHLQKSLRIREELKDRLGLASSFTNIGNIYILQGNYSQALRCYQKSLVLSEELNNKSIKAVNLGNIASVYKLQGIYSQALEYYQKSISLNEELKDRVGLSRTMNNIGEIYRSQGNYKQAVEFYEKSLALSEEVKDKPGIARTLSNIGLVYSSQGNYEQAIVCQRKSLLLREELKDKEGISSTLKDMGAIYFLQGNYEQALRLAEQAVNVSKQIGAQERIWQSCFTAGLAYRALNDFEKAIKFFETSVQIIETIRLQLAGGERTQQSFFEEYRAKPYYAIISLLIAQKRNGEAFSYAERAKARVIVDILQGGKVNVTKSMTSQEQEQERDLNNRLVSLNTQLFREKQRNNTDEKRLTDLEEQLKKARLEMEAFQTNLYAAHPELKVKRVEAQPISIEGAASLLPDPSSTILEFVVAEDQTYLFVLTKSGRKETALNVYTIDIKQKELAERVRSFRDMIARKELGFRKPGRELYELLIKPAEEQLKGKTTFIIVPEGPLWELPFQVLQTTQKKYLLEECAIFYAPSLTALHEMTKPRAKPADPSTRTLLALGNPALGDRTIERINSPLMDEKLEPLPGAEAQAKELTRLYGPRRSKYYIGAEAREEIVKAEAGNYRILQFATHGILNDASPMYSYLVLSQSDVNGSEDGLLEAWEIAKMDLQAETAILAACETGRGKIGAGEGVIGLSWAFFVAGCPATVVSQWKVEDEATKELMLDFHRILQARPQAAKPPISKAEALRLAALKRMKLGKDAHPFYWAGFVLVGNGN